LGNGGLISGAFSSDTTLSVPVAINKGGTGQTTAQAALDALAAASGSLVQGDIFIVDSSGNMVRLARGSDNQTLLMNGSNPNWETVSAGGATVEQVNTDLTSDFSTTGTSFGDITDFELDAPTITDGKIIFNATLTIQRTGGAGGTNYTLTDDGAAINSIFTAMEVQPAGGQRNVAFTYTADADGSTLMVQCKTGGNTMIVYGSTDSYTSRIDCVGVG